ncbi:MAG: flagellar filament capping protein FliD [Magnetococcales bacterium]|nr:flagellar filament capping protein FliD [Magnetococcales bacterium]
MAVGSVSSSSGTSGAGTLSFGGLASGLPADLVDQLMRAQQVRINTFQNDKLKVADQQSGLTALRAKLSELSSKVAALQSGSSWAPHTVSSSQADKVAATATSTATAGVHTIHVAQLAANDTWVAATGVSTTDTLAEGANISFSYNGTVYGTDAEVVTPGFSPADLVGNTLSELVDKINGINYGSGLAGVTASVMNDGSSTPPTYRLVLTARESGKNGADARIVPPVSLSFNTAGTITLANRVVGQNAIFQVDGVDVTSTSNAPGDVLSGVNLQLKTTTGATLNAEGGVVTTASTPAVVSVGNDTATVKTNLNAFVDAYNSVVDFINQNKDTTLAGSNVSRTVLSRMRSVLNVRTNKSGAADANDVLTRSTLAEYGLRTDSKTGRISFHSTALDEAIANDYNGLSALFSNTQAAVGVGNNPGLAYRFADLFNGMTNTISGSLTVQDRSLQSQQSRLDKDIIRENSRLETVRKQLTAKFSNMEQLVSRLNSAGSAVSSALGKLNNNNG